jgi:DNA-binding NtrC family response regulator
MKTLITWVGFSEDFNPKSSAEIIFLANGFTASVHRDIFGRYGFHRHLILFTQDSTGTISRDIETRRYLLNDFIKGQYAGRRVEFVDTGIEKADLQNYPVIESKLRAFLQSLDATEEIHIIAGTGPTAVGMAWCSLFLSLKDRFQLYVLERAEYTADKTAATLKRIEPFINQLLDDTLRETSFSLNLPANIYSDEIVIREYTKARVYAESAEMNILILGETGCGKDKLAEFIFRNSPLSNRPYRAINCASLQDEVLYSELFGHVAGAFTDAKKDRKGLFEECNGGTLFLDEIGDITPFMQQSLLRAIENKEIKKLGSNEVKKNINVRIIAATNNNLYEKCKSEKFRWDLYYRLCNPEIILTPYRDRSMGDRKKIVDYYLNVLKKKWDRTLKISSSALEIIEKYNFPGNFREIYNSLNALFPLQLDLINPEDLPARFKMAENEIDESYEAALKKHCIKIYKKYNFSLAATKKALGYKNSTQLKNKLIEWDVFMAPRE